MFKHPLAREIGAALIVKLIALICIYAAFFGPSHKTIVTPSTISQALFDSAGAR